MDSQSLCMIEFRNASGIRFDVINSVKFDGIVLQNIRRAVLATFGYWPRANLDWAY